MKQHFHYLATQQPHAGLRHALDSTVWPSSESVSPEPEEVAATLQQRVDETGSNYVVGQFAYGDMTCESLASIELFVTDVIRD